MNRVAAEFPLSNTQFQFWRIPFSNTARDAAGKLGSIQQRDRQEMQWRYKPVLSEYSRNSGRCTEPVTLLRCEQEKERARQLEKARRGRDKRDQRCNPVLASPGSGKREAAREQGRGDVPFPAGRRLHEALHRSGISWRS